MMALHGERSGRATLDLDIAIAISSWKRFKEVEARLLLHADIQKDHKQIQRFLYKEMLKFDIVPFGEIMQKDDKIYWPPLMKLLQCPFWVLKRRRMIRLL